MRICLVGLDNLPVLAPRYQGHPIGGESVQQTLLARALARRGHDVSMVVTDHGQPDGARWQSVRALKAYRPEAGIRILRFVHPRGTGIWSAMARADAEVYYTSCAGMQVGLAALFCHYARRRFVFRVASDADCDPARLLVRHARDRWLYARGLRRADAVLVQSAAQRASLQRHYGLRSQVAPMFVQALPPARVRDIDVLWVSNLRGLKRPDRFLALAAARPDLSFHMAGGAMPGEEALYRETSAAAAALPNLSFHGRLSYEDARALYARARVLVNTSEVEGFPNAYLQAWAAGVPVIAQMDPDGLIAAEGLGIAVADPAHLPAALAQLLGDEAGVLAASERCRRYIEHAHGEERVLEHYLEAFAPRALAPENASGALANHA